MALLLYVWLIVPLASARSPLRAALGRYYINWDGGMKACEGMDNKLFNLEKLVVEKKSKTVLALVGDVGLLRNSSEHIKFKLTLHKEVNGNFEYLTTLQEDNLCKHISEDKKPWTPFIKEMGISGCPIYSKVYTFKDSSLDTAGFPLSAAQAGHYRAMVETFDPVERTLCLLAEVNVQPL